MIPLATINVIWSTAKRTFVRVFQMPKPNRANGAVRGAGCRRVPYVAVAMISLGSGQLREDHRRAAPGAAV